MPGIGAVEGLNLSWPRLGPVAPGAPGDESGKAAGVGPVGPDAGADGKISFAEALQAALGEVNRLQLEADSASRDLALGLANIDEVMIAGQKAEIALRLTLAVRNKLMDAYNEIMRMQI